MIKDKLFLLVELLRDFIGDWPKREAKVVHIAVGTGLCLVSNRARTGEQRASSSEGMNKGCLQPFIESRFDLPDWVSDTR